MHIFDYSFLKDYSISSRLLGISNVIFDVNNKSRKMSKRYPAIYDGLQKEAVIESTLASNRIENIETTEKRANELLRNNASPLNHDEEEISGYRDAIIFITDHFKDIAFDEKTVKHLHRMLFGYSGKNAGEYKKKENEITATYADGRRELIFRPVAPEDVEEKMKQLFLAYNQAVNDSEINVMLLIPCVVTDFLAIHPFSDGNGRISRLLTLLLLYKEGYEIGRYVSYEKMIDSYKWNYYEEIKKAQTGWHENSNDYNPFIIFHFQMLYRCYSEINSRFNSLLNGKHVSKSRRIEEMIINSVIPLSKKDILDANPDISTITVEKTLSNLLKEGKIIKTGSYRNARYRASD